MHSDSEQNIIVDHCVAAELVVDIQKDLSNVVTVNPELQAALTAIRAIETQIERQEPPRQFSKLALILITFAPAFIVAGIVMLILAFASTGSLIKDALITVSSFLIVLGTQAFCVFIKTN